MSLELELWNNICESLTNTVGVNIGVAFSGGVDSSLVARACEQLNLNPTLLTVGFINSRDVRFANHIADMLQLEHYTQIIDSNDVENESRRVDDIVGKCSLSWKENCIGFSHIAALGASKKLHTIVTANGIDELFCGYNAYREIADNDSAILEMMHEKINNEIKMMQAINKITAKYNVKIVQPLLAREFIEYAIQIPLAEKIKDTNDLLRKHLVRRTAQQNKVPLIAAWSRKKALQYGSGIHKSLVASSKTLN